MISARSAGTCVWIGVGLASCFLGCNALFGIDEPTLDMTGSAAGTGGGGAAGTGGGAAGTGGGGAAGNGGSGAAGTGGGAAGTGGGGADSNGHVTATGTGGGPPGGPGLDETFGDAGMVTTDLDGKPAKAFSIVTLQPLPSGNVAVTGHYEYLFPEPFDDSDAFVAILTPEGALDPAFAPAFDGQEGFHNGRGVLPIDRGTSHDRILGAYIDEDHENIVVRVGHNDRETATPITRLWVAHVAPSGSTLIPSGNGGSSDVWSSFIFPSSAGNQLHRVLTPTRDADGLYFGDVRPGSEPTFENISIPFFIYESFAATARDGFVYVVSSHSADVIRFIEGGDGVSRDTGFGADSGYASVDLDALGLGTAQKAFAIVTDPRRNAYVGFVSTNPESPASAIVKIKADGSGLDSSFGASGVLKSEASSNAAWSCLLLDRRGRLVVAGDQAAGPVALRFSADGAHDGTLALSLPFSPKRCALDAAGRLLLAGSVVDSSDPAGRQVLALARLRLE
ncbi:hypothetical protein sce8405 [Sorangium cellulosum So ce56]|uniref:Uncharacterized protein n=1 Tax=Sorangium cellulosum (strain So ce56) TaxID=448385 RepID=A9FTX6_SORC5|nr:hypothetical protein [Sorangium cellulosum]CAN98575.1 hypothetical protein sce8405 [Sorangium cellulosum So ce56]